MTHLGTRWKRVKLNYVTPLIYLRYYQKNSTISGLITNGHFYLNETFATCEVFFEKVQEGFWMIAMEMKVKENIHYYLTPRNKADLSSVNFISGSEEIGYQIDKDIYWATNQVLFLNSGTQEIYVKKGTLIKCSRLIYSDTFLNSLAGKDIVFPPSVKGHSDKGIKNRGMVNAELFLQDRSFSILRYERNEYHYRASLFSAAYGLTTFFLNLSTIKKDIVTETADLKKKNNYAMLKAVKILEAHFSDRFPGIRQLALDCNISVSKLKRDFKETYGNTPLNYFRNLQITYSMISLKQRRKTIKELAAGLGFRKSSTFSTWHKKINLHHNDNTDE